MDSILLNSGGPDCRVIAALAREAGVHPLSVYYDLNPHNAAKCVYAAERTAKMFGLEHITLSAPEWKRNSWTTFPSGFFGYPGYTLELVTSAMTYCLANGARVIWAGFRDGVGNNNEWLTTLGQLVMTAGPANDHDNPVMLHLPLLGFGNSYINTIQLATKYNIDLSDTWSCNRYPCLGCIKCKQRMECGIDASLTHSH